MGSQIIQQPNGQYAIFSTITDTIVMWDADAGDVEEYFVTRAANQERGRVRDILKHVTAGRPEKAYYQFVMTWTDALRMDEAHGGDAWQDPATQVGGGE